MKITIEELCNLIIYIPNYQREYQWKKELVQDLVNTCNEVDLLDIIDETTKETRGFPGSIQAVKGKKLDEDDNVIETTKIVDAQQRITTFKLIELAIMSMENENINSILNKANKLNVHSLQKNEYDDFKDFLKGVKEYNNQNIYIRNFEIIKKQINLFDLNSFKNIFYRIEIPIRYEKQEKETSLYLKLNNNSLPLTLEEKHRSILLKNEKDDDLIYLYKNILNELNQFVHNKDIEKEFGKHLIEFLFIEYYEEIFSKVINSFNSQDTYQKVILLLLEKIKTKDIAKDYIKKLTLYLQSIKIASTKELINYTGQKIYNQISNFELNGDAANLIIGLIIYDLKKKYPLENNTEKLKEELKEIINVILIPYCFNILLTDKKPFATYNVSEVKSLYRNYFIISNKNNSSIYDTIYYEFIAKEFRDRKSKKEMINYINSSNLEYQNGNDNIRKALSYLYDFHIDNCTLEHIIPQSFYKNLEKLTKEEWQSIYNNENNLEYVNIEHEKFKQAVYSVGNFTLFTKNLNSSLGNKSPKEKAKQILNESDSNGFTTLTITHNDASYILNHGISFDFINKRKDEIKKLILNKINLQIEQSEDYIFNIKQYIDNEEERKNKEEALNKIKENINIEVKFDAKIIAEVAANLIEENYKNCEFTFSNDKLFDKLRLNSKYSKIYSKAINNDLEDYFNEIFKERILKQSTLTQLYHLIIDILNNKGFKVKLSVNKTIEENITISKNETLKRKFDRIKQVNEIVENAPNNNIVIIGRIDNF